jgi:hypothetical protein
VIILATSLWSPEENATSVSEARQPYLVAEETEDNYKLVLMGGSQLLPNYAYNSTLFSVLGDLTEEPEPRLIPEIISLVINCESGWNQKARGAAGEIGIAQFMPATWRKFNEIRGTDLDIYSQADQMDMILWAYDNNLMSHWTCWRQLQ